MSYVHKNTSLCSQNLASIVSWWTLCWQLSQLTYKTKWIFVIFPPIPKSAFWDLIVFISELSYFCQPDADEVSVWLKTVQLSLCAQLFLK